MAVQLAPVRVPSKRLNARVSHQSCLSENDNDDNRRDVELMGRKKFNKRAARRLCSIRHERPSEELILHVFNVMIVPPVNGNFSSFNLQ